MMSLYPAGELLCVQCLDRCLPLHDSPPVTWTEVARSFQVEWRGARRLYPKPGGACHALLTSVSPGLARFGGPGC